MSCAGRQQREIKMALFGDTNVGKTSLFLRFFDPDVTEEGIRHPEEYFGTLADCTRTYTCKNDMKIKATLLDTAGQEKYHSSMTKSLYRDTHALLFVYAVSDEDTLLSLRNWIEDALSKVRHKCRFYVIGNKVDLQADVEKSVSAQFVKERGSCDDVKETPRTSALRGTNVREMFQFVVDDIVNEIFETQQDKDKMRLETKKEKESISCCSN